MKKIVLLFSLILLISCSNSSPNLTGKWTAKRCETCKTNVMDITKSGEMFYIEEYIQRNNGSREQESKIAGKMIEGVIKTGNTFSPEIVYSKERNTLFYEGMEFKKSN